MHGISILLYEWSNWHVATKRVRQTAHCARRLSPYLLNLNI